MAHGVNNVRGEANVSSVRTTRNRNESNLYDKEVVSTPGCLRETRRRVDIETAVCVCVCVWVRPDQIRLWTLKIYREVPDASTKNEPAGPKEKFGCVSLRRGGRVSGLTTQAPD